MTAAGAHIGYQVDHSFGPPMVYIEGDRRDRPPLITINVAHDQELQITDAQARALCAGLLDALGVQTPAPSVVMVEGPKCAAELSRAMCRMQAPARAAASLIHIVGEQGVGKTLIAEALAAGLKLQGQSTSILLSDEALYVSNAEARRLDANSVIVEADRAGQRHEDLAPRDYLITLTRGAR